MFLHLQMCGLLLGKSPNYNTPEYNLNTGRVPVAAVQVQRVGP